MQYVRQQPLTVIQQKEPDKFKGSSVTLMTVLSSIQVVMGALCIIFGIVIVSLDKQDSRDSDYGTLGYGIWIGVLYVMVGVIGIAASKKNDQRSIIGSMVMNMICSIFWCFMLMGFAAGGIVTTVEYDECNTEYYWLYSHANCGNKKIANAYYAMDSLMMIMGLAEFVITIWSAVLGCGAVCRCCKQATVGYTITYANGTNMVNQPQVMIHPTALQGSHGQQGAYPMGAQPPYGYAGQPAAYSGYPAGYAPQQPSQPAPYSSYPQKPPSYFAATGSNAPEGADHQLPPTAFPSQVDG